jgi:hypothetical protein
MNMNRLIWMMDDETFSKLQNIMHLHAKLAKEATQPRTTHKRKKEIADQIVEL